MDEFDFVLADLVSPVPPNFDFESGWNRLVDHENKETLSLSSINTVKGKIILWKSTVGSALIGAGEMAVGREHYEIHFRT